LIDKASRKRERAFERIVAAANQQDLSIAFHDGVGGDRPIWESSTHSTRLTGHDRSIASRFCGQVHASI
jgi:hypothetical protein